MDERLKNIYDHFDSLKIGLDEQFKFNCTMLKDPHPDHRPGSQSRIYRVIPRQRAEK